MAHIRRRAALLAVCALAVAGCTASDETAMTLQVSGSGRLFVDGDGAPWFGRGDTAWSLVAEPTREEALTYLDDRQDKGFNLVLANLLENEFATRAPRNAYGDAPFAGEPFTSEPDEAYWEHVDFIVEAAAERGIVLLLCPAYLGFANGDEGFASEVAEADDDGMAGYGRFLADRYGDRGDIMWLIGHDRVPSEVEKSRLEALAAELPPTQLLGLSAASASGPLGSPAWESTSIEPDFETVYTFDDDPADTAEGWLAQPPRPVVFLEGAYEQGRDLGIGDPQLRRQMYGPFLSGAAAVFFGNNPIWNFEANPLTPFEGTWQENLDSVGSTHAALFGDFVTDQAWSELEPDLDGTVIVDGAGTGADQASVRWSQDRAVVFVPSTRTLVLDLSDMTGTAVLVTGVDPTTGIATPGRVFSTEEPFELTVPERNAAGEQDWVFVFTPR